MGSVQQVAMAAVCLVAAFAFGSYINKPPTDQTTQTNLDSSDSLRSLIEPELIVQRIPGRTPLMKPKLRARLPMPSLVNDGTSTSQFATGEIPPPSDLSGRTEPVRSNFANSVSTAPLNGIVSDAPTFSPVASSDSAMPVINKRNLSNSPNLADSMRAPFQTGDSSEPIPTVKNAPVFSASEFNSQPPSAIRPIPQSDLTAIPPSRDKAPVISNFRSRSESVTTAKPVIGSIREPEQMAAIRKPKPTFKTATPDQFRYSNQQRLGGSGSEPNGLMPIPSLNQTVTIDDPGRAFGNRDTEERAPRSASPQSSWTTKTQSILEASDYADYPESNQGQPAQRRVARLPTQMSSSGQTELTRLRDNSFRKISLSTTQYRDHVVKRGDSLQSIATQYFDKPDYYLDIYLANRDRLRFPGDLREGMSIKIPIYQQ